MASNRRFISELGPGVRVEDEVFLIVSKDLRTTTQGSLYIHCVLADRTGQMPARMWQATEAAFETMPTGGFLRFRGRSENYKGNLQFIIEGVRPVDPETIELSDFLPRTSGDVDQMFGQVKAILRKIKNRDLLNLIKQFIKDEPLMERFRTAPAAMQMHHAYIGGLLEHTLNVLELALVVVPRYPRVSMDLVLAGIFLHDLGKTTELSYETSFGYTDHGQLVGHITQAAVWLDQKARQVAEETGQPFPDELLDMLQHIVLSHHGSYEFGSPKLPAMPEAIAVHYLDNIDAKLHMFLREIAGDPDDQSHWTQFNRALGTKIYKVRPENGARE